jgi:nitroreductase
MTTHFPGVETIRSALALANRAPSVSNSQPWRWRVGSESVHLWAQPALHLPHTDPDRRDLMISCGAALNHAVVALAAMGWQAKVHRFPNPAQLDHLAAIELARYAAGEVDIALAAAIPRRRTDRRHFSRWSVPWGDIALMGARAARMGVTLRRIEMTDEFRSLLAQAVQHHANDPEYLHELAVWSGRYASTAGVPARNTPMPDSAASVPARIFAGPVLKQPHDALPASDNGVVVALGTAEDDVLARLRAGEATSLVLLTATASGLSSCPVTELLEVAETRTGLRSLAFGDGQFPQMLVRIGWAPVNAEPLPATPRRPVDEVVTWLDGSPLSSAAFDE